VPVSGPGPVSPALAAGDPPAAALDDGAVEAAGGGVGGVGVVDDPQAPARKTTATSVASRFD
jgi:hypothetical protein